MTRQDHEVGVITITKTDDRFDIHIEYTDGKHARLSSDGHELKWVFEAIRLQLAYDQEETKDV